MEMVTYFAKSVAIEIQLIDTFLLLALGLPSISCQSTTHSVPHYMLPHEVADAVFKGYDRRIAPNLITNEATTVILFINIHEMHSFSDVDMQFVARLILNRLWVDERLAFANFNFTTDLNGIILRGDYVNKLWVPDVYFVNERQAKFHDITRPNEVVTLLDDGTLVYSSRLSVTVSCQMDLRAFPLDTQVCTIDMESYTYDNTALEFEWLKKSALVFRTVSVPSFTLAGSKTTMCDARSYLSGGYSCIRISFLFERSYGYYIVTTYIPSTFVVSISWVAFWVAPDAVPGRITLASTTVLTIVTIAFLGGLSLPQVPYVKAVDVWLAGCMAFVFTALTEYAIVNIILRSEMRERLSKQKRVAELNKQHKASNQIFYQIAHFLVEVNEDCKKTLAEKIDRVSRFAFPISFILFAVSYWAYYLTAQNHDIDL